MSKSEFGLMDKKRIETVLSAHIKGTVVTSHRDKAPNAKGIKNIEVSVDWRKPYTIIVSTEPRFLPVSLSLSSVDYYELTMALRQLQINNPNQFMINGKPYSPESLSLRFNPYELYNKQNVKVNMGSWVMYYVTSAEETGWYCFEHGHDYVNKELYFPISAKPLRCVKCQSKLRNLRSKYRNLCIGCRYDYYNSPEEARRRGMAVSDDYGCMYLKDIRNDTCSMYSPRPQKASRRSKNTQRKG